MNVEVRQTATGISQAHENLNLRPNVKVAYKAHSIGTAIHAAYAVSSFLLTHDIQPRNACPASGAITISESYAVVCTMNDSKLVN